MPWQPNYIATVEEAVKQNKKICIKRHIEKQALVLWPEANFVPDDPNCGTMHCLLDDLNEGKCEMIALGSFEKTNVPLMNRLCEEKVSSQFGKCSRIRWT